jgi:hypothetical protein
MQLATLAEGSLSFSRWLCMISGLFRNPVVDSSSLCFFDLPHILALLLLRIPPRVI